MMTETLKQLLANQFAASLSTLGQCLDKCPDACWHTRVARYPFCQVAFHTLFYADFYLGPDEESFRQQPFHRANSGFFGDYEQFEDREPVSAYERPQLATYLEFCCGKALETITTESEATLWLSRSSRDETLPSPNCTSITFAISSIMRPS